MLLLQLASTELPAGYEGAVWGMSVKQLQALVTVHKAVPGSEYNYADHAETDPNVYVRKTTDGTRIEYYFHQNKLYKIYVVYGRERSTREFYKKLIDQTQRVYGPAKSHYQEKYYGITVLHVKWEDQQSELDLRSGAGFVYQVLTDKKTKQKKDLLRQRKNSI